jgi:hypothetical protein
VNVLIVLAVVVVAAGVLLRSRRSNKVRPQVVPVDLAELTTSEGLLVEPPAAAAVEIASEPEPEPEAEAGPVWIPPPAVDMSPLAPVPGEPPEMLFPQPRALIALTEQRQVLIDLEPAANPYEALRARHARVVQQVAAAYEEVHRVRTESLRRASEAEHSAELAATARKRAERVKHEIGRYTQSGRHRSAAMPTATDAFDDVHRFRVDALRRASEAERGAQSVAAARARAAELLKEQRAIEAEMARLSDAGL